MAHGDDDTDKGHTSIWEEMRILRERVHRLTADIGMCQMNTLRINELHQTLEEHKTNDSDEHKKIAELGVKMDNLMEIEKSRTLKLVGIVGAVTGVVTTLVLIVFELIKLTHGK